MIKASYLFFITISIHTQRRMTTFGVSRISARSLFLEQENIAFIRSALRLPSRQPLTREALAQWYDRYMVDHEVEPNKIEDVRVWADYMTNEFMKYYRGQHNVTSEQVPYLPFDLPAGCRASERFACGPRHSTTSNRPMIVQRGPYGRFPKFCLPSAVEDGLDENGEVVIHDAHQTIRIFQPITGPNGAGWRFGKNNPVVMKKIAGAGRLHDRDDNGSLYDWELLNRPHTKYPMDQFFSRVL